MAGDCRKNCRKVLSCPFGSWIKDRHKKQKKERKEKTAKGGDRGNEKKDHGNIEEKSKGRVSSGDFHQASRKPGKTSGQPQNGMGK